MCIKFWNWSSEMIREVPQCIFVQNFALYWVFPVRDTGFLSDCEWLWVTLWYNDTYFVETVYYQIIAYSKFTNLMRWVFRNSSKTRPVHARRFVGLLVGIYTQDSWRLFVVYRFRFRFLNDKYSTKFMLFHFKIRNIFVSDVLNNFEIYFIKLITAFNVKIR